MVSFNGGLTDEYGAYSATIIVHLTGAIFTSILILIKRERPLFKKHMWYIYLGGAVGVITTLSNNLAFGHISVPAILALGLSGKV